jgi:hypothetical protein
MKTGLLAGLGLVSCAMVAAAAFWVYTNAPAPTGQPTGPFPVARAQASTLVDHPVDPSVFDPTRGVSVRSTPEAQASPDNRAPSTLAQPAVRRSAMAEPVKLR